MGDKIEKNAAQKKNEVADDAVHGKNQFKLSHKKWRRLLKKERRKVFRQMFAQAKARLIEEEEEKIESDAALREKRLTEQVLSEQQEKWNEYERKRLHLEWLKREKEAIENLKKTQQDEAKRRKDREEQEKRIKEEWEQQQKLEKEKQSKEEEAKRSQEEILNKELEKSGILKPNTTEWHNPLGPSESTQSNGNSLLQEQQSCSFFMKTGACRFGDRCSRYHLKPTSSCTILIPNMFQDVKLSQSLLNEHDNDFALEYEDKDMYENFLQFYNDTISEFHAAGELVQFKVCCNYEPHLRGNVYAQYRREDQAMVAYAAFNGRWYAGRQLSVQFSPVTKWKSAICGLFHQQKCPKGKNCNFLHVFCNPGNEFRNADRDFEPSSTRSVRSEMGSHSERSKYKDRDRLRTHSRKSNRYSKSPDRTGSSRRKDSHRNREERRSNSPRRSHNDSKKESRSRHSEVEDEWSSSENESKRDHKRKSGKKSKKRRRNEDDDDDDDDYDRKKSKRSKHRHKDRK